MAIHGYPGGIISATAPTTSPTSASGVWTLDDQLQAGANWPVAPSFLQRSLRFRSSASAYLNRTPATTTNQKIWTFSTWVKRGSLTSYQDIFSGGDSSSNCRILFNAGAGSQNDNIFVFFRTGGTFRGSISNAVFRDPSAWYHLVVAIDTTQATDTNRVKIYINGVQQTTNNSYGSGYVPQNTDTGVNTTTQHRIGDSAVYTPSFLDGYLTEVNFIDGQALTPNYFGAVDPATGVWEPATYRGSYGTNGFYLPFTDNSSLTTSSNVGLGKDFSGNGNYWTTNNISITSGDTYDSMTDVPTLTSATASNFCVINPLSSRSGVGTALSNANLTHSGTSDKIFAGTIASTGGKFYYEYIVEGTTGAPTIGVADVNTYNMTSSPGETADSWTIWLQDGGTRNNATSGYSLGGFTTGNILQIAWDVDSGKIWFGKNNTWGNSGNPATDTNPAFTNLTGKNISPVFKQYASGSFNFGQRPFAYTPPTGFVALNTFNLPTPTIGATASTQADNYFDAKTYTGTGATQTITVDFAPDFAWLKRRDGAGANVLLDRLRLTGSLPNRLFSNLTDAESTAADGQNSFSSTGIVLDGSGGGGGEVNTSGRTYVAWQWNAGGSTVTNTSGSISSQVRANPSAGFSIVTYTGTGANATVGHGLGVAPQMIIIKSRSGVYNWRVWHTSLSSTELLFLNTTDAKQTGQTTAWNSTLPTSTVFSLGSSGGVNEASSTLVAYCFAEVAGYSRFGSYTGNGSSDGPFVYTGFRPRFILVKNATTGGLNWEIVDTAQNPTNVTTSTLAPNTSGASASYTALLDITSNGFKIRDGNFGWNQSGATLIYAAFAENPFKYSLAR